MCTKFLIKPLFLSFLLFYRLSQLQLNFIYPINISLPILLPLLMIDLITLSSSCSFTFINHKIHQATTILIRLMPIIFCIQARFCSRVYSIFIRLLVSLFEKISNFLCALRSILKLSSSLSQIYTISIV